MNIVVDNKGDISIGRILKVVLPLVISALSMNLMFFIDRLILLHYSADAMNAAALGGNLVSIYVMFIICIAGTSEIFVGQFNGAGKRKSIAIPVWQMIYFSIASLVVLVPLGIFAKHLNLIPEHYAADGIVYQKILTYFACLPGIVAALTGFFVGRGKTKIITLIVLFGCCVNFILDCLFVFGYRNIIPAMGCRGAAIATVMAEAVQALILAIGFWSPKNRIYFSTLKNRAFNKKLMSKCIGVGLPSSLGHGLNLLAWYLIYATLSHVSKELSTIHGIAVAISVLFEFICEGLVKGTSVISANFIGQKNLEAIRHAIRKLLAIAFCLAIVSMAPVLLYQGLSFRLLKYLQPDIIPLLPDISVIFRLIFIAATCDSLLSVFWGALISGGDAKFPNIVNLLCIWTIVVIPVLMLGFLHRLTSATTVYALVAIWEMTILCILYRRYKSLKWYKSLIN